MKKPKLPRQTWTRSPATKVKESKKSYHRQKKVSWEKEIIPQNQFRFCPRCSAELVEKRVDHRKRLACLVCGFVYYNNPVPACAVILEQEGKILLCQRKYPPYPEGWTLPAGFLEANETPQECAKREAKEETNLEVAIGDLFGVYIGGDDPRTKVTLIVFTGRILSGSLQPGDDAKAVGFFAPTEIPRNIAFRAHRQVLQEFYALKNITFSI
jgi:ADP-ribose pyrophosphatase YjhB (NUDIX family)